MEIIKSKFGIERTIERIDFRRIRVMGESQFVRTSTNETSELVLFDFEGGPFYSVGGKLHFEGLSWKIDKIKSVDSGYEGLYEVILYIEPIYP